MEPNNLLNRLYLECSKAEPSKDRILSLIEELLVWLNQPENNTDNNCKKIDYFVTKNIITNKLIENLWGDVQAILLDIGGALHDTHTSPEIAENFESTPQKLLERVQKISNNKKI